MKKTAVELRSLDAAIEEICPHMPIDFMKIDVEGHEDLCLEGGVKVISNHRPTMLVEINRAYFKARQVHIEHSISRHIPNEYSIFRFEGSRWITADGIGECGEVDDMLLVPNEKLKQASYKSLMEMDRSSAP